MNNNFRPVYEQPIYKIIIPVCDLSLDKAIPQFAAAIDAQIDCDDASEDFKKKKLHSNIRSSSTDSMTRPYRGGLVYKRTRSFPPPRYNEIMLPLINPAPFLCLLLVFVAALFIGVMAFFLGILKGKEIEATLHKRS